IGTVNNSRSTRRPRREGIGGGDDVLEGEITRRIGGCNRSTERREEFDGGAFQGLAVIVEHSTGEFAHRHQLDAEGYRPSAFGDLETAGAADGRHEAALFRVRVVEARVHGVEAEGTLGVGGGGQRRLAARRDGDQHAWEGCVSETIGDDALDCLRGECNGRKKRGQEPLHTSMVAYATSSRTCSA